MLTLSSFSCSRRILDELLLLAQFGSNTMPYRGLGSGIPRVMASGSDVELIDRPDGNQFIARIWRTTQKDEITTQKANEELLSAIQKEESTTQKRENTIPKPLTTTQKAILNYLKEHPKASRQEVVEAIGETETVVKSNIGRLEQYGLLKRVGGRKNGQWIVINAFDSWIDSQNDSQKLLNERQKKIVALICKEQGISIVEIASRLSLSTATVHREIKKIKALTGLYWEGTPRNGYWVGEVIGSPSDSQNDSQNAFGSENDSKKRFWQ